MHQVWLAVGLYALTFMSPGPNLLVVVQNSLLYGRGAGVAAGAGVATGDAIYCGLGLFGLSALIASGGMVFAAIKVLGGLYLVWYGLKLLRRQASGADVRFDVSTDLDRPSHRVLFRRGLLTDLANPQTVLFFASIFSVTLTAQTASSVRGLTWLGLVLTSLVWRIVVSYAFSRPVIRRGYFSLRGVFERIVGAALMAFGVRLVYQGFRGH